jgi:hypothetical protein
MALLNGADAIEQPDKALHPSARAIADGPGY